MTAGIGDIAVEPASLRLSRLPAWAWPVAIVAGITLIGLIIRLFRLDGIPAEMWGDVTEHYSLAQKVMGGGYFFDYEFGGDGPLFSYLAAFVAWIGGLSFYSLKLTSALAGVALIPAVYFYTQTLFDSPRIGYIAALLTSISFWPIVVSRQAKPYILVPVFAALALGFALRRRPVLAGIAVGLGMYTQASFWGVPLLFVLMPAALPVAGVVALPVIRSFVQNPDLLFGNSSYIGSKLHVANSMGDRVLSVLDNFKRNALSFNFSGDQTFRQNIVGHPHLDVISGIFFLLGLALLLIAAIRNRDRRLAFWFLLPLLVFQIPMLADQVATNSPNTGRLAVLIPVTMAAIAYGIDWSGRWFCRLLSYRIPAPSSRVVTLLATALVFTVIAAINLVNYFDVYPKGLPNNNTPFDLVIAQHIDSSPAGTSSILAGCCWGDWGNPEPNAVVDRTNPGRQPLVASDPSEAVTDINNLSSGTPVAVYLDPRTPPPSNLPLKDKHRTMLRDNGLDVAWMVTGKTR